MNTKVSIFISILLIFSPLILFANETNVFAVIIMIIIFISSFDNIVFYLNTKNDKKTLRKIADIKEDFQKVININVRKLGLGFSASKAVLITFFALYSLYFFNFNDVILILSPIAIFLSIVEFLNRKNKKDTALLRFLINLYYLAFVIAYMVFFFLGQ